MERPTYPFPLAVNSSHHSHYHRFLLGADASILAPFPKPYCRGALSAELKALTEDLNLPRWRKLYHGAIPWVPGYGRNHYAEGNVPAYRPLPPEYARPIRRFGAFDFVQIADPSVSALALVAGDRRVLDRFVLLGDDFCARLEPGVLSRTRGPSGSRNTGRMLTGQFAEPNNRWLMPFLHVHARVLNFTSFMEEPERLTCIDGTALSRTGSKEKQGWIAKQAEMLCDLGYRASVRGARVPVLRVEGVPDRLLAAMEAPRIAVLSLLERTVLGEGPPSAHRLASSLPITVIAAMAEQLEILLARSLSYHRPPKIGIPSEGPWRSSVREHLGTHCPDALLALDAVALRAKAKPCEATVFPTPALDPAHCHAPGADPYEAVHQMPTDAELGAHPPQEREGQQVSPWLAREFARTLSEVNERIVRQGTADPTLSFRAMIAEIDQISEGPAHEQLRQGRLLLGVELDRAMGRESGGYAHHEGNGRTDRGPRPSLDDLFERVQIPRISCEQAIGGRSL
jgi:hypothetical protein